MQKVIKARKAVRMWTSKVKSEMPASRPVRRMRTFGQEASKKHPKSIHLRQPQPISAIHSQHFSDVLFGVRADIKQQPLRPGTVSEGPLPKGSRPPGLFRSSCLFVQKIYFNRFSNLKCISCRHSLVNRQVGVTCGAKVDGA